MGDGLRVGWLGGSFDPVHDGHLAIARCAAEHLGLSRVLMVPAALPPHKRDRKLASGDDRLALLSSACRLDERLEPCPVELERGGASYSYDTALELSSRLGQDVSLFFVIGADTLQDLGSWYRIAELAALVTFCAVTRPGSSLDPGFLAPLIGEQAVTRIAEHVIEMEPHPAASTQIRERLARGEQPDQLPPGVYAEILARGLYGAGGASSRSSSRSDEPT
jgi:nicotinate-nucleotide adenylyltransferase